MSSTPDISRNIFNASKQYEKIVFQQGRELLDSEMNELQDIQNWRDEKLIEALLGDTAIGNGFKIVENTGANTNNFKVTAGCFFFKNKLLCLTADMTYSSQAGVPALTTPAGARTDTVYLKLTILNDISETEDTNIVDTEFGETTHRVQNTMQVLVAENSSTIPANSGNTYYVKLATLARTATASILAGVITDNRISTPAGSASSGLVRKSGDSMSGPLKFGNFSIQYNSGSNSLETIYG
jgi:hypothetical protein